MTRPIERYVRCSVDIPGSKGRVGGTIEIGLHYDQEKDSGLLDQHRWHLIAAGRDVVARFKGGLDVYTADLLTEKIDAGIVAAFGDRPRFIEVWFGKGDDAEPLTQIYAPHGMPRAT